MHLIYFEGGGSDSEILMGGPIGDMTTPKYEGPQDLRI
jgi:hypothetical protein